MADRIKKYAAKISGDNRKRLYDSQKPFMIMQEAAATHDLVKIEKEVKQIVMGEPIIHIPYYIIFGKEIYKKQNKFKDQTLINEIEILQRKWMMRGLELDLLDKIKKFYVQAYKIPIYFRLDISLLDGPDVLA